MELEFIKFEINNSVAKITLNRPDVLNSFHSEMAYELQYALNECNINDAVRCILLTGEGRAFCAGQDLSEVIGKENMDLASIVHNTYNTRYE